MAFAHPGNDASFYPLGRCSRVGPIDLFQGRLRRLGNHRIAQFDRTGRKQASFLPISTPHRHQRKIGAQPRHFDARPSRRIRIRISLDDRFVGFDGIGLLGFFEISIGLGFRLDHDRRLARRT